MTNEEIMTMDMESCEARLGEIRSLVEDKSSEADFDALSVEVDALEARKAVLVEEQRKADIQAVIDGQGEETKIEMPEVRKMATVEEIRNSKEYIEAYAKYIKTGKETECRALLTELADDGVLPVPAIVEEEIKVAWDEEKILAGATKTFIKGILRVGFELSAEGALVHVEGDDAGKEEELVLGIVSMVPASIKKWITISDEALDLGGEAFLRYIYDELTHQIAKKLADLGVDAIEAAPATSGAQAVGVPVVEIDTIAADTIAQAIAQLSDRATNACIIMNKQTLPAFKAVAYAAGYPIDVFEGLPVIFNNTIKAYDTASAGETYVMVGDLKGLHYNFPNGDDITIKYDDLSLAEADLVKLVGRAYAAVAVDVPGSFVKISKEAES